MHLIGEGTVAPQQSAFFYVNAFAYLLPMQDALESSQTDRDRLQWLERELGVQMQRADAALQRAEAAEQERAALDGRIKLLEVSNCTCCKN